MQISNHARYLGVEIGPGAADHKWTKAENKFVGVCARIRSTSNSLVHRLVSVKIFALSVLTFTRSVAEPDKATNVAENNALQRPSAAPFPALPAALLRWRSTGGVIIAQVCTGSVTRLTTRGDQRDNFMMRDICANDLRLEMAHLSQCGSSVQEG